jgi:hypothetical protein
MEDVMRGLTVTCNLVLLLFTLFVLATDWLPEQAAYVAFTLLLLLIPTFTAFALLRRGVGGSGPGLPGTGETREDQPETGAALPGTILLVRVAVVANLVLLAAVCWALVDQSPHPKEEGFLAYAVLTLLTPVLSAIVLVRTGTRRRRPAVAS